MKRVFTRITVAYVVGAQLGSGCGLIAPLEPLPSSHGGNPSTSSGGSGHAGSADHAGAGGSTFEPAAGGVSQGFGGHTDDVGGGGTDAGLAGAAGSTTGGNGCSQTECAPNARCVNNQCVDVLGDSCQQVLGAPYLKDESTILVGGFAPYRSPGPQFESIRAAYEIVLHEVNEVNGGLRGGVDQEPNRVALILCDNEEKNVAPALTHLLDRLRVPAILAHLHPAALRDAFDLNGDKALFVSPLVGSHPLQARSNGRVWSMLGVPKDFAAIYKAVFARLTARLGQELMRSVRVAAVRDPDDTFQSELAEDVLKELDLNGQNLLEHPDFWDEPLETPITPSSIEATAQRLREFQPDVVLSFADTAITDPDNGVISHLERRGQRPTYILNPQNAERDRELNILIDRVTSADNTSANSARFMGIAPVGPNGTEEDNVTNYLLMQLRVFAKNVDEDVDNFYEAMSFLVYALYASGPRAALRDGSFSVAKLVTGMRRVTDHEARNRFPMSDVPDVLVALNGGTNIALIGPRGVPVFNDVGMRVEPGSVFCFVADGGIRRDVIRYDTEAKTLTSAQDAPCLWGFLDE